MRPDMASPEKVSTHLRQIGSELSELARLAGDSEAMASRAPSVSGWSVGEHVEHLAASDQLILDGLLKIGSDATGGKPGRPNLLGRICLTAGWIPRGRGRAPEATVPRGAEPEEILRRIRGQEEGFAVLADSAESLATTRATVPHPVFGRLGRRLRDFRRVAGVALARHGRQR